MAQDPHAGMTNPLAEAKLYEQLGEEGFADLVRRFYERVRTDDILSPMYPQSDWEGAERRLLLFLIQRFGGPTTYSDERGHH
ncbi:MAG: hypothetical protein AAGK78_08565, partial [Planctomycetota bacterium]